MSDIYDGSIDKTADLHDFLNLYMEHRAEGEVRELTWYLDRFPGDEVGLAREYLALVSMTEPGSGELFAGRYKIIRELGRGGQGVVSLARDTLLDRLVALKTIEAHGRAIERLRREAEIACSLDHPGICAIHEANFDHSPAYVVMRYIEGESLALLLARRREARAKGLSGSGVLPALPHTVAEVHCLLGVIERIARALHVAHERGIVHRDIKPGNLIVTPDGDPIILDFGLARLEEPGISSITMAGEALGTPAYMSPEQVRCEQRIDRTTDVYSLGLTLYECLTLHRPFDGPSRSAIEWAVLHGSTDRPSSLNVVLPREVDAVLAVALEKDPRQRYTSAAHFADDLRRIQAFEPILASPPGALHRGLRWVQRNRRVAAVQVILMALLALVGSLFLAVSQRGEERLVESLTREAREYAKSNPAYAYAVASEAHRRAPNTRATNDALLQTLIDDRDLQDLGDIPSLIMDWEGGVVATASGPDIVMRDATSWADLSTMESGAEVSVLDLSPEGGRLLVGGLTGKISIWDIDTQRVVTSFSPSGAAVSMIVCRWETGRVFSGDVDGRLFCWSLEGDSAIAELHDYPAPLIRRCLLSPDGSRFVSFAKTTGNDLADGVAHIWDPVEGRLVHTLAGHGEPIYAAAMSRDGAWLATASSDRTARVWDLKSGACLATLRHPGKVLRVDFGPRGAMLATSCDPGDLAVESGDSAFVWAWKRSPEAPRFRLHQDGSRSTYDIAYSPSGDRIATANLDGNVILWDAVTGNEIDRCQTAFRVTNVRWGPAGEQIFVTGDDFRFFWKFRRGPPRSLKGHQGPVLWAGFSANGAQALTASADGTAKVWDVAGGRCLLTLNHDDVVRWAESSADGSVIVTGCDDGNAWVWRGAERVARLGPHAGKVTHGRLLEDGRVVTATDAGELRLWDERGNLLRDWAGHVGPIQEVRTDPLNRFVASAGSDCSTRLWSLTADEPVLIIDDWDRTRANRMETRVFDLLFLRDGSSLITIGEDAIFRWVSIPDGRLLFWRPIGIFGRLALLPNDELVACRKWAGQVVHYAQMARDDVGYDTVHSSLITHLAVSPQGYVLTTSADATALLQRLEEGRLIPHMRFVGHERHVTHGAFSPDGQLVVTASLDGTAWIWPVHPATFGSAPRELTKKEKTRLGL